MEIMNVKSGSVFKGKPHDMKIIRRFRISYTDLETLTFRYSKLDKGRSMENSFCPSVNCS